MNTLYRVAKSCSVLSFTNYDFIIGQEDFIMFMTGLGYPKSMKIFFNDIVSLDAFDKLCREYGVEFQAIAEYGTYSGVIE